MGRRQHLLFISERSRLPVVLPIGEAKRLGAVFPDAVCERLAIVGVAAADIADERSRMSETSYGRTQNPSLLGTVVGATPRRPCLWESRRKLARGRAAPS
ncbi:MAG: DUF6933 domain-containing protein [Thermoanaerobaculia bacterium]